MPIITRMDRCLVEGLGFTEGPVWTRRGTLRAVGLSRGLVYDIDPASGATLSADDVGGAPNGLAEGADGAIWITQAGGRGDGAADASIQRLSGGRVEVASPHSFHAPNDLAFGPDGRLWFTDPQGHDLDGPALPGRVWALDTVSGVCSVMADGLHFPNGLAFTPDGTALVVAETIPATLTHFALERQGLGPPERFAMLPDGRPDGIAFDAAGNLFVAATQASAVLVFAADGTLIERLEVADGYPTNLCFGGDDMRTLFVTSAKGGRIYSIERDTPGLTLFGEGMTTPAHTAQA